MSGGILPPTEPIPRLSRTAGVGHLRPSGASSATGCRAPKPAVRQSWVERVKSTTTSFTTSPADGRVWPRSRHSHRITDQAQRVEIISAKELHQRWSDEEKRLLGTVLGRISGHPASRLDELLPWNWKGRSARLVA